MNSHEKKNAAHSFATAFAAALGETIATLTETEWPIAVLESAESTAQKGTTIHFRLAAEGALAGECYIEFYEPHVLKVLSAIARRPVTDAGAENLESVTKILASAAEKLGEALTAEYGAVRFRAEQAAGLAFGGMYVVALADNAQPVSSQALLYFSTALLESMSAGPGKDERELPSEQAMQARNLRLVMDVELNVSLRFGQRQLPLRDVLDLRNGSIVELDRMVDEPVELYLGDKLIARGEAVVVDGNYGLRVTEIPQPVASHFIN